ncbi:MAG: hypothetical protein OEW87_08070, partial [Flavobacteriaceae bacterium]|nr:hypothetical protein [Flavobacteriaceae bacterium]
MSLLKQKLEHYTRGRTKVYIIPTGAGIKYAIINFGIFLIALSYANNMALLINFIMVTYFIIQMLETHKIVADRELKNLNINNFFSNEQGDVQFFMESAIDDDQSKYLRLSLILRSSDEVSTNTVHKVSDNMIQFTLSSLLRGHYETSYLKIYTVGPSNLFYAWKYFSMQHQFYIYPEKKFLTKQQFCHSDITLSQSTQSEFDQHILYQYGMSSKRIDWKVFARSNA